VQVLRSVPPSGSFLRASPLNTRQLGGVSTASSPRYSCVLLPITPIGTFFWICAGLSCALARGAAFVAPGSLIPRARTEHTLKGLDWIGVILSAIAIFCIVFPLGEGGNAPQGWKTPFVWIILGVGIVVSALFVLWEMRLEKRGTKPPLMRMSIWNKKMFASLMLADLCLSGAFGR
jgi:tryptophan-rich sensory protein